MTDLNNNHSKRKARLFASVGALAVLTAAGGVIASQLQNRSRLAETYWSLDARLSYSDNFRRLPEQLTRIDQFAPDPATGEAVTQTQTVRIDTPDNLIATVGLRGTAIVDRAGFAGYLSGGVDLGAYLDDTDIENQVLRSSDPGVPANAISSSFGLSDAEEYFIDPDINASFTARLVENLLYVDASALATVQQIGRGGFATVGEVGQSDEEVTYIGGSISPYVFRQFANGQSLELRARGSAIEAVDERFGLRAAGRFGFDPDTDIDDVQFTNDSYSGELSFDYSTGDMFGRTVLRGFGSARHVEEDGSDILPETRLNQTALGLNAEFIVTPKFSVDATVGYDTIDFTNEGFSNAANNQNEDDLDGSYYEFGFKYEPNRRTLLDLSVGERYGGTSVNLDGRYRMSPRVVLTATATRQLNSGAQDLFQARQATGSRSIGLLSELSQSSTSERLIDRALAFNSLSRQAIEQTQFGIGTFDRAQIAAAADLKRTTLRASLGWRNAEQFGQDAETYSITVDGRREITRKLYIDWAARWAYLDGVNTFVTANGADGDFTRDEEFYRIGAGYTLGPRMSLVASVGHAESDSDGESVGGTDLDYEENTVSVGVRWTE